MTINHMDHFRRKIRQFLLKMESKVNYNRLLVNYDQPFLGWRKMFEQGKIWLTVGKLWLVIRNLYLQQNIFKFCIIIKKGKPWLTGRRERVPSWVVGAHNVSKKQSGGRDLPDNMGPPCYALTPSPRRFQNTTHPMSNFRQNHQNHNTLMAIYD